MGERISIKDTRRCIDSILDGSILEAKFSNDKIFDFEVPLELNGVSKEICNPRDSWKDKKLYDNQAKKLADMFINNYENYIDPNFTDYSNYGPKY